MIMEQIIGPVQKVLITTRGNNDLFGKTFDEDNICVTRFHSQVSRDRYMISLHKNSHSVRLIKESGNFIVNFMPYYHKENIEIVEKLHGINAKKHLHIDIEFEEGTYVDAPRVQDANGFLECTVEEQKEVEEYVLFIGKIAYAENVHSNSRILHTHEGHKEF
jgi:flavin reductase (DIM6/NTAB) family NADH-FMN oxidoreductase RutF